MNERFGRAVRIATVMVTARNGQDALSLALYNDFGRRNTGERCLEMPRKITVPHDLHTW
jgi:hypothetical protein